MAMTCNMPGRIQLTDSALPHLLSICKPTHMALGQQVERTQEPGVASFLVGLSLGHQPANNDPETY